MRERTNRVSVARLGMSLEPVDAARCPECEERIASDDVGFP
ncbi:hypothetical protein [Halogeometricum salsisoli]|nr:hypothetical protein [Halogeometricum sp. S1BR25-6]